jgi:hypothetical protein
MFSSAYTSQNTNPTIEDWAKKINTLEDRVEPVIMDMQTRIGMGITPIALKNREYELAMQGVDMKDTYNAISKATEGLKTFQNIKTIPYVSPLLDDEEEENKPKKTTTKTSQMMSKPSANDFLEGEEE